MAKPTFDPTRESGFVAAVLRAEPEALDKFTERLGCVPRMLATRNAKMGSPLSAEDLQDLTQDTFVVILRRLADYRASAPLEAWIYGICCLQHTGFVRAKHRRRTRFGTLPEDVVDPDRPEVDSVEHAHILLSQLSGMAAEVVKLKHFEGLTFDELAERLAISPNTAKTLYYRALRRIRKTSGIEQAGEGEPA